MVALYVKAGEASSRAGRIDAAANALVNGVAAIKDVEKYILPMRCPRSFTARSWLAYTYLHVSVFVMVVCTWPDLPTIGTAA